MKNPMHSAISNVHYTPIPIVQLFRQLMGYIDLDPASDHNANIDIDAKQIFTEHENGYVQSWVADTVFCNPPGRRPDQRYLPGASDWFFKMLSEYNRGNFNQGIFIGYSLEIMSKIAQAIADNYLPHCYPQPYRLGVTSGMGRIKFDSWDADSGVRVSQVAPQHANIIIYFPPQNYDRFQFKNIFSELGAVIQP